jgi:prolyl oligopeptidase
VNRQKAFDDFIAVAEDLVARKITSPARLGIYGASNGGILVSAVMTQRPELFGAVVARVPLTDMLRYAELLAGASWVEEKGDPRVPAEREVLAKWSPYHQVKPERKYPPILFIGNRNDDRVHPAHARKMAAKMLEQGHRVWLFEEMQGGHSGTSNPQIYATREALLHTFMMGTLNPAQ